MKYILIAILILFGTLFAEGYRYSVDIVGTSAEALDQDAFWTTVNNGANNVFSGAETILTQRKNADGVNRVSCNISGVLTVRKQGEILTFSGTGRVNITLVGATVGVIVGEDMATALSDWANTYREVLRNSGIVVTAGENTLTFQSYIAGFSYDAPVVTEVNGDLSAEIQSQEAILPDVEGIDMLIYDFFDGQITITDFETHSNRDFY